MKNKVAIRRGDSVVIYTNPANIAELVEQGGLLNPDLTAVRRYPPHTWRVSGGKIVADLVKLNAYYKDKGCVTCVKKLSVFARIKIFFVALWSRL